MSYRRRAEGSTGGTRRFVPFRPAFTLEWYFVCRPSERCRTCIGRPPSPRKEGANLHCGLVLPRKHTPPVHLATHAVPYKVPSRMTCVLYWDTHYLLPMFIFLHGASPSTCAVPLLCPTSTTACCTLVCVEVNDDGETPYLSLAPIILLLGAPTTGNEHELYWSTA